MSKPSGYVTELTPFKVGCVLTCFLGSIIQQRRLYRQEMPGVCGHDLLSNLPGPLIEEILNWLPLRDAVRTSILSRAWRHHWKTIRRLDFDLRDPDSYLEKPGELLLSVIDHVLSQRSGSIEEFDCRIFSEISGNVGRWLLYLANHGIQHIALRFYHWSMRPTMCDRIFIGATLFKLPSFFFSSCKTIVSLSLFHCELEVIPFPSQITSFSLRTLRLFQVQASNKVFESLFYGFPRLEKLVLYMCIIKGKVKIASPCLRSLTIIDIHRVNMTLTSQQLPGLHKLGLRQIWDQDVSVALHSEWPSLQKMKLSGSGGYPSSLLVAAAACSQIKFSPLFRFNGLVSLSLVIHSTNREENLGLVQVLAGSPHLRRLEIICSARKRDNYCTKTRRRSAPVNETEVMNSTWGVLKELRSFDIVYMTDSEIKYVEGILARAPALETLGVYFKGASLEALNLLPRASPNVKILQLSSTDLPDW
ncbi:hypothetical protein H6P81_020847 [Aristolochia fimbriata]|uniref:F-box domain-containing protein n=1 Tax=Aristolochia fimbriata TaxID=158543 RepID=A0AAV7E010_ARIFI|nr:hypothetical protein H6P81_020847 [Aristolochia fimbriata]